MAIIIIVTGTIPDSLSEYLCRIPGEHVKTAHNTLVGHCTVTSESVTVKVQHIQHRKQQYSNTCTFICLTTEQLQHYTR